MQTAIEMLAFVYNMAAAAVLLAAAVAAVASATHSYTHRADLRRVRPTAVDARSPPADPTRAVMMLIMAPLPS
jgi:hypothetical protein